MQLHQTSPEVQKALTEAMNRSAKFAQMGVRPEQQQRDYQKEERERETKELKDALDRLFARHR